MAIFGPGTVIPDAASRIPEILIDARKKDLREFLMSKTTQFGVEIDY